MGQGWTHACPRAPVGRGSQFCSGQEEKEDKVGHTPTLRRQWAGAATFAVV